MSDFLIKFLEYLRNLKPQRALLHIITVLCLVLIYRYANGDYDQYIILTDPRNNVTANLRRTYAPIFLEHQEELREILIKTGAKRISLFMYHDDYVFTSGKFKSLKKTAIETVVLGEDTDYDLIMDSFQDIPVQFNDELDALLNNACYVNNPMVDFYLENLVRITSTDGIVAYPIHNLEGYLIGFVTMSFKDLSDANIDFKELNDRSCLILEEIATKIEGNRNYIKALLNI